MHETTNTDDGRTDSYRYGNPDRLILPVTGEYEHVLLARKSDVYHLPSEPDADLPKCGRRRSRFDEPNQYMRVDVDSDDPRLGRRRLCRNCDPTAEVNRAKEPTEQLCTKLSRLDADEVLTDGGHERHEPAEPGSPLARLQEAVKQTSLARDSLATRPDQDSALAKAEYLLRGVVHELEGPTDDDGADGINPSLITDGGKPDEYPMYCPECDELVPELWDRYDEAFRCPNCKSSTYEDKEAYIEVKHATARFNKEHGYGPWWDGEPDEEIRTDGGVPLSESFDEFAKPDIRCERCGDIVRPRFSVGSLCIGCHYRGNR